MISHGDRGPHVASLQRFLIDRGHLAGGQDDSVWGPISAGALITWQRGFRLAPDGIPGPATLSAIKAAGWDSPRAMTSSSPSAHVIPELVCQMAIRLGVRAELLDAFRLVESGAGGPAVRRFEPHLFIRARPGADISYTRGAHGVWSLVARETGTAAFRRAYAIDPELAVRSTSWGLFQVLGGHLLALYADGDGQPDPQLAVASFENDPEAVSYRLVEEWFAQNPAALRSARDEDLRELVRRYNGDGPNVSRYTRRLESALATVEGRA